MLVPQQPSDQQDAEQADPAETLNPNQPQQGQQHADVQPAGHLQGPVDAVTFRDGEESLAAIEAHVLTGIDDVEPGCPEQHRQAQEQGGPADLASHGNPGAQRGQPQTEPQVEVGEPREPLAVGVEQQDEQHGKGQEEAERVELVGRQDENEPRGQSEDGDEEAAEMSGRQGTGSGPGIEGIDPNVRQPVEGHGRASGSHHGHHDPQDLTAAGPSL